MIMVVSTCVDVESDTINVSTPQFIILSPSSSSISISFDAAIAFPSVELYYSIYWTPYTTVPPPSQEFMNNIVSIQNNSNPLTGPTAYKNNQLISNLQINIDYMINIIVFYQNTSFFIPIANYIRNSTTTFGSVNPPQISTNGNLLLIGAAADGWINITVPTAVATPMVPLLYQVYYTYYLGDQETIFDTLDGILEIGTEAYQQYVEYQPNFYIDDLSSGTKYLFNVVIFYSDSKDHYQPLACYEALSVTIPDENPNPLIATGGSPLIVNSAPRTLMVSFNESTGSPGTVFLFYNIYWALRSSVSAGFMTTLSETLMQNAILPNPTAFVMSTSQLLTNMADGTYYFNVAVFYVNHSSMVPVAVYKPTSFKLDTTESSTNPNTRIIIIVSVILSAFLVGLIVAFVLWRKKKHGIVVAVDDEKYLALND